MLRPSLQYQSLKTVLLHTDANTRFRISAHMPSIRDVEKVVPLKMSRFDIYPDRITVETDTEYKVGIVRHFTVDSDLSAVAPEQNLIWYSFDFDKFGFPFTAGKNVVLPGDVSFQLENRLEFRWDTKENERELRETLTRYEKALKMQTELKSKGITVEDYLKSLGPVPGNVNEPAFEEETRMRRALTISSSLLSNFIGNYKLNLIPYDCRKNNTKPPFTFYIQLDITKGKSRQIQRFEYNKKLFEASKGLNEALFGRRKAPIQVGRLFLNAHSTIHRLPMGFRLHAKHVHTVDFNLTHASFRLLVENSERLECIEMKYGGRGDAFQTETVRRAKRLVIHNVLISDMERLTQIIRNLSNLEITILDLSRTAEETFNFIQAWLSANRPVGASCCIEVRDVKTAEKILTLVQTQYERAHRNNRCVTIQKTESTRAEVFYVPFTPSRRYTQNIQWLLKSRIVNV